MDKKVAVVTGGAQGIGAACVKAFLSEGYAVAICDVKTEVGRSFVSSLGRSDEEVKFYQVDVSDEESVQLGFKKIMKDFKRIDILVNNAGITRDGLFLRMKSEQWNLVLKINLTGAFFCSKAAVPVMVRQRYGRIINIASVVGLMGNVGQANYSASKAGIIGMTKSLARELASRNITVNAIAPGFVETEMTKQLNEKAREELLRTIPLNRGAAPEEIADAVVFLASDKASYITGHVLNVNGGMYM